MGTKILVPLDGSVGSEGVLAHLRWLAPPESTEIVLVSVVEMWQYTYGMVDYRLTDISISVRSALQSYLERHVRDLQEQGYAASLHVADGDPAMVILEYAKSLQVHLIAMSTHGRSGFARWALGSVAERVLHESPVPVFLVRPHSRVPEEGEGLRILVPVDGSALSEEALTHATELAQRTHGTVYLLHALYAPIGEGMRLLFDSQEEVDEMLEEWRKDGEKYLAGVLERLTTQGIAAEVRLLEGMPDEVIENEVAREKIDVIVMSTHGRTGVRRWVYGSVANRVLRAVDSPILLIRTNEELGEDTRKVVREAHIVPRTPIHIL